MLTAFAGLAVSCGTSPAAVWFLEHQPPAVWVPAFNTSPWLPLSSALSSSDSQPSSQSIGTLRPFFCTSQPQRGGSGRLFVLRCRSFGSRQVQVYLSGFEGGILSQQARSCWTTRPLAVHPSTVMRPGELRSGECIDGARTLALVLAIPAWNKLLPFLQLSAWYSVYSRDHSPQLRWRWLLVIPGERLPAGYQTGIGVVLVGMFPFGGWNCLPSSLCTISPKPAECDQALTSVRLTVG